MPSEPEIKKLGKELKGLDMRVGTLEDWRKEENLYKKVLADVKAQDIKEQRDQRVENIQKSKMELYKQALIIAGLIATLLTAYVATRSH